MLAFQTYSYQVPFAPSLDLASDPAVQNNLIPLSAVLSNEEWLPDSPLRKTISL